MKVAIAGAEGRMGKAIRGVIDEQDDVEVVAEIDEDNSGELESILGKSNPDVYIEFTGPAATLQNSAVAAKAGIPLVIGTTGFSDDEYKNLEETINDADVAAVVCPNMSRGVNVVRSLLGELNKILPEDFAVEITDIHHRNKKDAPSGTAKLLQKELSKFKPEVHSTRAGSVPGTHTVMCFGDGEQIEITHRAESRVCSAAGTVQAARFVMDKGPGIYSMNEVLCQ